MLRYFLLVECSAELSFVMEFINCIEVMVEQFLICVIVKLHIPCRWNNTFDRYDCLDAVCEQEWSFSCGGTSAGSVGPKHTRKLVCPKTLCFLELLLNDLDYSLVSQLRLPIGFWIARGKEGELDSPFLAKVLELE